MKYYDVSIPEIRKLMLEELHIDILNKKTYISKRLNDNGKNLYINFLKESLENGTDETLANNLKVMFNSTEKRNTKNGIIEAKIPNNANLVLAESEFNRFYIRGVCRYAIENQQTNVEIYRAKEVVSPRHESNLKIGTFVSAQKLLDDLRENTGVDTALKIPPGPNSGLSVKLIK